jgi:hypothetical protein
MEHVLRCPGKLPDKQKVLRRRSGGGVDKPAVILTQFVDYTLVENAARWRDCEPFLTSGELKNSWQAFFSSFTEEAKPEPGVIK